MNHTANLMEFELTFFFKKDVKTPGLFIKIMHLSFYYIVQEILKKQYINKPKVTFLAIVVAIPTYTFDERGVHDEGLVP
jgi:hypothetical protein